MKVAATGPKSCLPVQDSSSKGRVDSNSSKSASLPLSLATCDCSMCKDVLRNTAHLTCSKQDKYCKLQSNIRLGDRVIVRGKYTGVVKYVGDLDSSPYNNDQIYVGLKTDEPTGNGSDGLFRGKRFFKCPPGHGLIVPVTQVVFIPIPGKSSYERRKFVTPARADRISKRCNLRYFLQQQAEKLQPVSELIQCSYFPDMKPPRHNIEHLTTSTNHPTDKNTCTGLPPTVTSPNSAPANGSIKCESMSITSNYEELQVPPETKSNTARLHKITEKKNDDFVSAWKNRIHDLKNSPSSTKIFVMQPLMKEAVTCKHDNSQKTEPTVKPKASYASRLISGLPKEDKSTPDTKLQDVEEFSYWMKQWGGGVRGWKMARARQKLKQAQRLGTKQTKWQETIDKLERDPRFRPQVERIKLLQNDLAKIRSTRQRVEDETRAQSTHRLFPGSCDKTIAHYSKLIEKEQKRIKELESSIDDNPISLMVDISKLIV